MSRKPAEITGSEPPRGTAQQVFVGITEQSNLEWDILTLPPAWSTSTLSVYQTGPHPLTQAPVYPHSRTSPAGTGAPSCMQRDTQAQTITGIVPETRELSGT